MMKRQPIFWMFCLSVAAAMILWSDGPFDIDDAYITYRYAENLAGGNGFVYNPGEQILGTSTPLYTLLLAGSRWLGVPTPTASAALNFVGSLAVFALTILLAQRLSGSLGAALLATLYLLMQGSFIRYTMAGMETPLYTLLILLTFWFVAKEQFIGAAFLAGLTAVMRLDGLAVGGALFLAYLLHHRRLPWRAIMVYGITLLPWTLFAFLYFGSPIPLSMLAKQEHLQIYNHNRFWIWEALFTSHYGAPTVLLAMAPLGLLTFLRRNGWAQRWTTIVIWLVAYLVAYTVVGIDFYEWYIMPVYPVLAILIGSGLYTFWAALSAFLTGKPWPRLAGYFAAIILLYWFIPYGQYVYASVTSFQQYITHIEGPRHRAGQWLQANIPVDATVYAGAIGHIGYYAERYIIDGAGLVTPLAQIPSMQPDYYAIEGHVVNKPSCGPFKEFMLPAGAENPPMLIWACNHEPLAKIGSLLLSNLRIGQWVRRPDLDWVTVDVPLLEMQWRITEPIPPGEWTIYMHYLDGQDTLLFQTDHPLGRQLDGSVRSPQTWATEERIYTYVDLPDDWPAQRPKVTAVRLGVWNPSTQAYLPITPIRPGFVSQEGLLVPLNNGEFVP